jgi:hypothetical protein
MSEVTIHTPPMPERAPQVFWKDTLINGEPAQVRCLEIGGQTFSIDSGLVKTIRLEDEWFQEVADPRAVIDFLKSHVELGDILTFCQRLPNVEPRFPFPHELESIAAIEIDTYEQWWKQLDGATRNMVRKSAKLGVEVKECAFDDDFVRGMTAIFNETPIRQGRRFWHYGKDVETVRQQFSRFLFREELIGAYCGDELIGFAMLGKSAHFGDLGQIISKLQHRDKAPTNALIAKAVELCAARGLGHLVYAYWSDGSLGKFKQRSGFREVQLPRYFVPLTARGRLALRTGMHRGVKQVLPPGLTTSLKRARNAWYEWAERNRASQK